jgi:DNA-binding GntR family transcriptional regulator
LRASEILLRRVWPERKGRIVEIDLPQVHAAADLPKALSAVMAAMAAGEITPDEASAIAAVIESKRKVIETADLDRRLTALESAANEGRRR